MPDSAKPPRLAGHQPGLDGVRGIAILLVIALHFVGDSTATNALERVITKAATFGLLGVDLFFVLSGFLITGLLIDAKGKPGYFRNFYARRTLRIFPLYYAVLAVAFLVLPLVLDSLPPALEDARPHQVWLWTYTSNFYIAAKSEWVLGYLSHFWSLAIEEHFYFVWPLVVYLVPRDRLERVCLAVIAAGLALRIGLTLWGMSELSISVLTPARVDTLCVGALLAAVARRAEGPAPLLAKALPVAAGLFVAIFVLSAVKAATGIGVEVANQVRSTLYALFFGAFTLLSLRLPGIPSRTAGFFETRPLMTIGKYAYGLYVYHAILSYQLHVMDAESLLTTALGGHGLALLAKATIGFGGSFALAVVSYELFEKPFLKLKRHFETVDAPPRPAAVAAAAVQPER